MLEWKLIEKLPSQCRVPIHPHPRFLLVLIHSENEVAQSCPTLCDPMNCNPPASLSMGFSRQESWSGLPFPFQGIFPTQESNPGLLHCRQILYRLNHQESRPFPSAAAAAKSLQSCPTLCNPINGSPPGSPVPGILQARILEWVAMSFSNA